MDKKSFLMRYLTQAAKPKEKWVTILENYTINNRTDKTSTVIVSSIPANVLRFRLTGSVSLAGSNAQFTVYNTPYTDNKVYTASTTFDNYISNGTTGGSLYYGYGKESSGQQRTNTFEVTYSSTNNTLSYKSDYNSSSAGSVSLTITKLEVEIGD